MKRNIIIALICLLIGALASGLLVSCHFKAVIAAMKPVEKEVIIRDTISVAYPVEIEKRIIQRDSIMVNVIVHEHDTVGFYLPREQKVYADSSYRAVVSGVEPRLDSISVYNKTVYKTEIHTQKEYRKFSFGVQVGGGLVQPMNGQATLGVYTGVGLTYHF